MSPDINKKALALLDANRRVYAAQNELKLAKECLAELEESYLDIFPNKFTAEGFVFKKVHKSSYRALSKKFYAKYPELSQTSKMVNKKAIKDYIDAGVLIEPELLTVTNKTVFSIKAEDV